MKNLTNREKYLILLLGIAVLLFLYAKLFLLPVLDETATTRQAVQDEQMQVSELTAMKTVNENMRKSLTELQKKYESALIQLPDQPRNPEVAYNLKPLADISNVTLMSVSLGDGEQYSELERPENTDDGQEDQIQNVQIFNMPVTIEGTAGSYSDVMDFVDQLEKDKRFTRIKSLSINAEGEMSRGGVITGQNLMVNINIDYFYTTDSKDKPSYYFNNGSYGKEDLFR